MRLAHWICDLFLRRPPITVVLPRERRDKTACRECGCTNEFACAGGCWWVEPDLCSACHYRDGSQTAADRETRADSREPGLTFDEWWERRQALRGPYWPMTAREPQTRHVCGRCSCCRTLEATLISDNDALRTEVARLQKLLWPDSGTKRQPAETSIGGVL